MKIARIGALGSEKPVVVEGDQAIDVSSLVSDWNRTELENGGYEKVAKADLSKLARTPLAGLRYGSPVARPTKVICVGLNYIAHIAETGADTPKEPVIFMKPDTAILPKKTPFVIPEFSNDVHHEVEVLVKICKVGKYISPKFAHKYYDEIGLGIDFTARDLQAECKAKGLPWELAKAFDQSAVVSSQWLPITPKEFDSLSFEFHQNSVLKQHGNPTMMLFNIDQIIAYISKFITLKTGDLIFTGTPAGVGPIAIGDELVGTLNGKEMYRISVK